MDRREQNQAARDWIALKDAVDTLDPIITTVLLRGTYDSGIRRSWPDIEPGDSEKPPWADETGETAIRQAVQYDAVERSIAALAAAVHRALNIAKSILDIEPEMDMTNVGRPVRVDPACLACGDPCVGGARNGFDNKCRMRWHRAGRPDRGEFIALVQRERAQRVVGESR